MKKLLLSLFGIGVVFLFMPSAAFAADTTPITQYTSDILGILTLLATLFSTIFLIKGGYTYMTSSGNPQALENAKKTIRNALIGLAIVIGASTISSILTHAFGTPVNPSSGGAINLSPIQPVVPQGGVVQLLVDAIIGVIQNIILSGAKPLVDGVISMLTTTPSLVTNSVVFNFWLVILGITDTLFAIIIAILGFHFMSSSAFGFEEVDLKHVMGRIVLAFLGANMSIFLIDRIISLSNALVNTVLNASGGLAQAWVLNVINPATILSGPNGIGLLTLLFMLLFLALTIVLLLYYIGRLIILSLGAVLSPLIFLLWALPAGADFAKISIRTYLITIFTVFIHVVTIQIASSFLTVTSQAGTNTLISLLVGIGLFFTLLKIPGMLINMAFYSAANAAVRGVGSQVSNIFSSSNTAENTNGNGGSIENDKRPVIKEARTVDL